MNGRLPQKIAGSNCWIFSDCFWLSPFFEPKQVTTKWDLEDKFPSEHGRNSWKQEVHGSSVLVLGRHCHHQCPASARNCWTLRRLAWQRFFLEVLRPSKVGDEIFHCSSWHFMARACHIGDILLVFLWCFSVLTDHGPELISVWHASSKIFVRCIHPVCVLSPLRILLAVAVVGIKPLTTQLPWTKKTQV